MKVTGSSGYLGQCFKEAYQVAWHVAQLAPLLAKVVTWRRGSSLPLLRQES